jgi:hypothetical protein
VYRDVPDPNYGTKLTVAVRCLIVTDAVLKTGTCVKTKVIRTV